MYNLSVMEEKKTGRTAKYSERDAKCPSCLFGGMDSSFLL